MYLFSQDIKKKEKMNSLLSCGPILEPLIGIVFSSIISIIILFFIVRSVKKSEFYETEYCESSNTKKIGYLLLFSIILIGVILIIFFILTLLIATIVIKFKKLA